MKIPVSWLRELVDIDVPAKELAQKGFVKRVID